VENLRLYNLAQFGGSPFLDVPDLYLQWDPRALALRNLRLKLVRIALNEVNIVEGRNGQTNLVQILDGLGGSNAPGSPGSSSVFGLRFAGIDTLNLSLGRVKYTSLKRPSRTTELKLDLKNEILMNVRSMADLTNLVMATLFRNGITITTDAPAPRPMTLEGRPKRKAADEVGRSANAHRQR
jgi:hypothetical protein